MTADGDGVITRNTLLLSRRSPGDLVYHSTVLTASNSSARQVVLLGVGPDGAAQALLDDTNTTVAISVPPPSLLSVMQRYLVTGIEHIFFGYDHIAFLIAIVLWARRLLPVIKIVTAFTLAHSITLSLAALQIVVIPSTIVEPAIAASIVFVAVENFFSRDIDGRWKVDLRLRAHPRLRLRQRAAGVRPAGERGGPGARRLQHRRGDRPGGDRLDRRPGARSCSISGFRGRSSQAVAQPGPRSSFTRSDPSLLFLAAIRFHHPGVGQFDAFRYRRACRRLKQRQSGRTSGQGGRQSRSPTKCLATWPAR